MRREKRETQPAFCPIQSARKSTHAGRIEWQANRAFAVRSVNRMFVRTTGRPRDEIGTTAWCLENVTQAMNVSRLSVEPLKGCSVVSLQRFKALTVFATPAGKQRDVNRWIVFSEGDVRPPKANNLFPCSASKNQAAKPH